MSLKFLIVAIPLLIRSCSVETVTVDLRDTPSDRSLSSPPSRFFPGHVDSLDLYNTPFIQSFLFPVNVDSLNLYNTPSIRSKGGYKDNIVVTDINDSRHGQAVQRQIQKLGIPGENIVMEPRLVTTSSTGIRRLEFTLEGLLTFFGAADYPSWWYGDSLRVYPDEVRVVCMPIVSPFQTNQEVLSLVRQHNVLFVKSVGNTSLDEKYSSWHPDASIWGETG